MLLVSLLLIVEVSVARRNSCFFPSSLLLRNLTEILKHPMNICALNCMHFLIDSHQVMTSLLLLLVAQILICYNCHFISFKIDIWHAEKMVVFLFYSEDVSLEGLQQELEECKSDEVSHS